MVDIQPDEVALGIIFDYPNAIGRQQLVSQLENYGYEATGSKESEGLFLGQGGPQIGEATQEDPRVAGKDSINVLYNSDATIDGVGDCSFITLRSEEGKFEPIFDEVDNITQIIDNENITDQINIYELTVEGNIRVSSSHDLTQFYSSETLSTVNDTMGSEGYANIVMLTSHQNGDENDWYRFILDSISNKNPRLWRMKFNRRHQEYDSLSSESVRDQVQDIVSIAEE